MAAVVTIPAVSSLAPTDTAMTEVPADVKIPAPARVVRTEPRVLLVAHHCNPEWGSEPLIGWRWVEELDRRLPVTLVTHVRNRRAIEAAGRLHGEVRYVDTERLARTVNAWNDRLWPRAAVVNRSLLEAVSLRAFDRAATRIAKELASRGAIDVIHRVSPLSPRAPSRLGTVGLPFVLGPLNGGMETAPGFVNVEKAERAVFQRLRPLARVLDPFGTTFRRADAIFAATRATIDAIPEWAQRRTTLLCENAVEPSLFTPRFRRSGSTLRVLYLGRLLPYKGVEHLIRAVATLPEGPVVQLDIVGDGPDRARLESIARNAGGAAVIRFHGAVPVADVPKWMESCDLFCLPSVRESGGAVVLEAMAAGKPVVVADHGGPSETVTTNVGVKVPATNPDALVAGFRAAITRFTNQEKLRERTGWAAWNHVIQNYTWAAKADQAIATYDRAIAARRRRAAQ